MEPDIFGLMLCVAISNGLADMASTNTKTGLDPGGVQVDPGDPGFDQRIAQVKPSNFCKMDGCESLPPFLLNLT